MTLARSTNARSLSESVWDRRIRAVEAQLVMPMIRMMTTSWTLMPKKSPEASGVPLMLSRTIGARIRARTKVGRTRKKSVMRISTVSIGAADVARDDAHHRAEEDRHEGRHQADGHRDARAVDGQVEDVAPELVGAQEVRRARADQRVRRARGDVLEGAGQEAREDRHRAEDDQDGKPQHARPLAAEAAPEGSPCREAQAPALGPQLAGREGRAGSGHGLTPSPGGPGTRTRCRPGGWRARRDTLSSRKMAWRTG